jgi:hypothetical protein
LFLDHLVVHSCDAEQSLEQPGVMPPNGILGVQNMIEKLGIFDNRSTVGAGPWMGAFPSILV